MSLRSPDELYALIDEVISKLKAGGKAEAARILEGPHHAVFTTGSEWLGEIGAAVRQVESECDVSAEERAMLEDVMRDVHRVWPNL